MNLLKDYPESGNLKNDIFDAPLKVNGHIHTPFSFSAFDSIDKAVQLAKNENVQVLGINDFYTTAGYSSFYARCLDQNIFPLFNIEFMGLSKERQEKGIRVNDPSNPGRTYFSGKGLHYPVSLDHHHQSKLNQVRTESDRQIDEMIYKLNDHFAHVLPALQISKEDIIEKYAKDIIRERHLAKAIRVRLYELYPTPQERRYKLSLVLDSFPLGVSVDNEAGVENKIRSKLLKSGGVAFVPENENAYLSVQEIRDLILNAGGIPCYPVLLDDKNGNFTDFEADQNQLLESLKQEQVFAIELIPGRNDYHILKDFVKFFHKNDFLVLFGTEHNTPDLTPMSVTCRNNTPLDEELQEISWQGACVVAAHQYLHAKGMQGYVDQEGFVDTTQKQDFAALGNGVIKRWING
jgi:hypothetical protein